MVICFSSIEELISPIWSVGTHKHCVTKYMQKRDKAIGLLFRQSLSKDSHDGSKKKFTSESVCNERSAQGVPLD